jgi:serine protease inhibitor
MTSNTVSTSNIGELVFSEEEKKALKSLITEKMRLLNSKSAMSLSLFLNTIEISSFGNLPYSMEHIKEWNEWIRLQKIVCIEKSRSKAVTMPKIHQDKFTEFFKTLSSIGLLDGTNNQVTIVTSDINQLLSPKNPT